MKLAFLALVCAALTFSLLGAQEKQNPADEQQIAALQKRTDEIVIGTIVNQAKLKFGDDKHQRGVEAGRQTAAYLKLTHLMRDEGFLPKPKREEIRQAACLIAGDSDFVRQLELVREAFTLLGTPE